MQYRKFGNTGIKISTLGFGAMRLPEKEINGQWFIDEDLALPLLMRAFELGVNYFDTAPYYLHKNSETTLGKALKSVRDKVYLSTKIPMENYKKKGDFRRCLEQSLTKMQTDYIDFYHFWGINKGTAEQINANDIMKEVLECKEQGLLRFMSFSFHDAPENIKFIIDNVPGLSSILCQYNLLDRSNEDMIDYARDKGLGTVIMGPVGGGRLSAPADLYKKLTGKESNATYELALRFVLGNQNVNCALSGMGSMQMLEQNVEIANKSSEITAEEWNQIAGAMEQLSKFNELYCTGCGYCQPCPSNINIPKIFQMYTYHNVYGLSEGAKGEWWWYKNNPENKGKTYDDCATCGQCEEKCPQKLKVISELEKVCTILDTL